MKVPYTGFFLKKEAQRHTKAAILTICPFMVQSMISLFQERRPWQLYLIVLSWPQLMRFFPITEYIIMETITNTQTSALP